MLRFVSKFQGPDQDQDQNRDRYLTCRSSLLKRKKALRDANTPTDPVYGEDRCTQFRVIVVTDPCTHTQTHTNSHSHRQDRLQYTAPLSLARSVTTATTNELYTTDTEPTLRYLFTAING